MGGAEDREDEPDLQAEGSSKDERSDSTSDGRNKGKYSLGNLRQMLISCALDEKIEEEIAPESESQILNNFFSDTPGMYFYALFGVYRI